MTARPDLPSAQGVPTAGGLTTMGGRSESPTGQGTDPPSFEYDPTKSVANKAKHGVDFEEAQAMWDDPHGLVGPVSHGEEARLLLTARLNGKTYTAVWTRRGEKIRLISVRRAREKEVAAYDADD